MSKLTEKEQDMLNFYDFLFGKSTITKALQMAIEAEKWATGPHATRSQTASGMRIANRWFDYAYLLEKSK